MTARRSWTEIESERADDPQVCAGYDRARRAFELGGQVRKLRLARGMSQTALGRLAGTTQASIARIEAGGVLPTLDSLERIGAALNLDVVVRFEPRQPTAPLTGAPAG